MRLPFGRSCELYRLVGRFGLGKSLVNSYFTQISFRQKLLHQPVGRPNGTTAWYIIQNEQLDTNNREKGNEIADLWNVFVK